METVVRTRAVRSAYDDVLEHLDGEISDQSASLAVLLIDVADVPRFQARLGFEASAALLQSLHDGFAQALAGRGHVLTLGDGRYCAIVRAMRNGGHAVLAGEKLVRTADDVFNAAGMAIKPKLNIGLSLYPSQARAATRLLRLAQLATEAARNRASRVVVFDDHCDAEVLAPWALGDDFARALDTGELSVYYQPKISMTTGRLVGVEALMRWFRDGKPVATPDVFIPLAEEAGLIHAATWYSLSNSLRMSADTAGLSVAVNITPGMLHHREFINMVRTAMTTWRIEDQRLTLEITEGALIADFAVATKRMKELRDLGVRISIDDFGTGYSSLSYFKKIPAHELKIDKSFVMGMTTDAADQQLVRTIVDLARHFELTIVAEGVENRATFDALSLMGCHQAQGYLFSPALSAIRLKEWMTANSGDLRLPGSRIACRTRG
jgi:EAL domain-containing protein (putative c-di-GMP-specific phosphodiesterase class I)/GGDEF domain-containing protein